MDKYYSAGHKHIRLVAPHHAPYMCLSQSSCLLVFAILVFGRRFVLRTSRKKRVFAIIIFATFSSYANDASSPYFLHVANKNASDFSTWRTYGGTHVAVANTCAPGSSILYTEGFTCRLRTQTCWAGPFVSVLDECFDFVLTVMFLMSASTSC